MKVFEVHVLHLNRRKAISIGHTLSRNCRLKHIIEGSDGNTRRRKSLLDDLQKKRMLEIQRRKRYIALCYELALDEAEYRERCCCTDGQFRVL